MLEFCRYGGAVPVRRANMLKIFRCLAGFVAASGLVTVGPVTAAESTSDLGSTKPPVSQPLKSIPADARHSKVLGPESSVAAVTRPPAAARPAGVAAVHSSKAANLAKAPATSKLVSSEKRSKPAVKVAAVSAVAMRPAEVGTKNAASADDVGALSSTLRVDRSTPMAHLPVNPPIPPGDAYIQARSLEGENQVASAIPLYTEASRQGHSAASLRLMEIYAMGAEGVSKNYIAAVEFKRLAVQQGAKIEYPPHR